MDSWSVIIYGRTKEADYRFLAIPDDFGIEEQNWARKYIRGTTVYPEGLEDSSRWSLFKNHKHCVFGVTCMVQKLIGSEPRYEYMANDAIGRSLYIFVGYVAKINAYFDSLKILCYLEDLDFFKSKYLLESLETLWHLKDYQLINRKIDIDKYPYEFKLELNYYKVAESESRSDFNTFVFNKFIDPNFTPFIPCSEVENQALVWPDSPDNRKNLWENSCRFLRYSNRWIPLSICLGFTRKEDVLQGPFSNATVFNVPQRLKLVKRKSKVTSEPSNITTTGNRDASNTPHISSNSPDILIEMLLYSISWKRLRGLLLISILIFLVILVIWKKYTLAIAILISLLVGFYLGIIFESSTTTDSRTPISNKKR